MKVMFYVVPPPPLNAFTFCLDACVMQSEGIKSKVVHL